MPASATLPAALVAEITSQSGRPVAAAADILAAELKACYGESLMAVILYGSCLRTEDYTEGVADLYAVVDSYDLAYPGPLLPRLNRWLPPNVFYIEKKSAGEMTLRAKYAVITMADLQQGCTRWFHSYIWARFAQPARILYAREAARGPLHNAFAGAVLRLLDTTLPVLTTETADTETIWTNALSLTYAAELRPERAARAREIVRQNLADLVRLTRAAAPALTARLVPLPEHNYQCTIAAAEQRRVVKLWRLRRAQGRLLSILRLVKAVYTFRDCVDYAAWKIRRHTGVTIQITPRLQRHPILFGFSALWQLLRRGILH